MARFLHRFYSFVCRKSCYIFLALIWIFGLLFGVRLSRSGSGVIVSLMEAAVTTRFSIVCLLGSLLLPFLFSAFAVFISMPRLLYGICFVKAALFGFVSGAVTWAFPGSGWLIRYLFLSADQVLIVLLILYWLRHIAGFRRFSPPEAWVYLIIISLAAVGDYYYFAPLLRKMFIL